MKCFLFEVSIFLAMHSDTRTGGIEAVPIALYQDEQGGGLDFKFTSDIFYQIIA